MYTYPWYHWITFFYIYCFCGWIFESAYVSLKERRLINRGFLRLPMLPIYGTGAVMMLWVSLPVQDNLVLVYIFGVIAATALEYVTGFVMERLFKMKYWDYSSQRFHFQGYICLSSSIAWGFLTIVVVKVIHRPIADFVLNMSPILEGSLMILISIAFILDAVKSVREALALGRALEAMTRLKAEAEEMQVQLALLKAEATQKAEELYQEASDRMLDLKRDTRLAVAELKDEARTRVADFKEETLLRAAEFKAETKLRITELQNETNAQNEYFLEKAVQYTEEQAKRVADLTARLQKATENRRKFSQNPSLYRKGLLLGNPTASSRRFAEALGELRNALRHFDDSSNT